MILNKMVKIKKIEPPVVEMFNPDGESIGTINEYEFLDARVQIKEQQLSGYSFTFKNSKKYKIDKNGNLEDCPLGLFDSCSYYFSQLI